MAEQFTNSAQSSLSAGITSGATTLTVASATGFPTTGNFRIIIDSEILLVTGVSGTTFTVTRAAEAYGGITLAAAHSSGAAVTHILTAASLPLCIPPFVAAGGSHAAGIVPDPGATANTFKKLLQEDATWGWKAGEILASNFVATSQSTTSNTAVDLTTADSVTFTLDATTDVFVFYKANVSAVAVTSLSNVVVFDGTADTNSTVINTIAGANYAVNAAIMFKKVSLSAGSHTIKVQSYSQGSVTGSWSNRQLIVFRG